MKKITSLVAALVLVAMLFSVPALAHGGHGARQTYALCTVQDCNASGLHQHGTTWYSGHYFGDGHEHHTLCSDSTCTLTTVHTHDGVTCFPHAQGDGHSYHAVGHRGGGRHH